MFKPCLAFGLAALMGLALSATRADAQGVPGGPGGSASSSPLSSLLNQAVKNPKDRNTTEHDLKAAEAGLADADPRVRVEALRKLRNVDDPKADYLLIRAMSDPDTRVKVKAIDILGSRGNTDAVPTMCQFLFLRSTESVVKLHIAAALGRIGDTRGAQPLVEYLGESDDERSRGTAVYALGEIGDPSATDVLTTAASEDPSPTVRRLAREAIQKIDGEIPSNHPVKTAKQQQMIPTDQRLSKMREMDQEMNHY
jgi:HEAT repeat protein